MLLVPALLVSLAWGAFAFGAVYPWTYAPLALACTLVGIIGLLPRRDVRLGGVKMPLLAGLGLVAVIVGAQLVPLRHETLVAVSPGTDRFLARYDLQYQMLAATERLRRDASPKVRESEGPKVGEPRDTANDAHRPDLAAKHAISIDPPKTQLALALYGAFALMLVGLARGLTSRDVRRLASALVAVGVTLALVGIVQKATYGGKIYGFWTPYATDAGPFGPFVNRNHFAGWMLMALPVGLGYFLALVGRGMRGLRMPVIPAASPLAQRLAEWQACALWFASPDANRVILVGVGLLVMGVSLVMTLSRSGITCFTIALLLIGIVAIHRHRRRSTRALAGGYLLLVFLLAVGWAGLDTVVARFELIAKDYTSRTEIWNDAYRIHHDFPWLGTGVNAFGTAMGLYQTAANRLTHAGEAHNDYLQLLAEGGVALAVAVVLLIVIVVRLTRRTFRQDTDDEMTYWIRVGAVTGLVAIALQEVGEFSLQMPGNAALFATLLAIALGKLPHRGTQGRPRLRT